MNIYRRLFGLDFKEIIKRRKKTNQLKHLILGNNKDKNKRVENEN
jgi:hypothetical protein